MLCALDFLNVISKYNFPSSLKSVKLNMLLALFSLEAF